MGFQVPLGGDSEEGDSCLEVFFGYVRRGIANEVLRAVRRWALDGSERDGDGNTAVHIAAIHGSTSIVEVHIHVRPRSFSSPQPPPPILSFCHLYSDAWPSVPPRDVFRGLSARAIRKFAAGTPVRMPRN